MSTPQPQLSSLADPISLGRIQVLLVPIQLPDSPLSSQQFDHWSKLFRSHTSLRSDELRLSSSPSQSAPRGHAPNGSRGHPPGYSGGSSRTRFLPSSNLGSISKGPNGPGGLANHVHLSYTSHPPARHLANLSLLRISLFPLVVIGIALDPISGDLGEVDGYTVDDVPGALPANADNGSDSLIPRECFDDAISSLFPPTSPFPLVKRLVLVPPKPPSRRSPHPDETPKAKHAELNGHATLDRKGKGVDREVFRAPSEGEAAWVVKLLGEVVGDTLGELGDLVAGLETPQGLKILSATLLPSLTSNLPDSTAENLFSTTSSPIPDGEMPRRPSTTTPSVPKLQPSDSSTAAMGISLKRALTPGGRPTSVAAPSLPPLQTNAVASSSRDATPTSTSSSSNPFRRSSAIPAAFTRSSSAASVATTSTVAPSHSSGSKYTTVALGGLAGGRLLKLLGDMYLLAGMYGDAIKCFDDGAERCRSVGDVLWEALAREGRAVAGIGEAWEGRDGSDRTQPFPSSPIPVEILTHFLSALACLSRAPLPYPSTILSPSPQAVSGSLSFAAPSSSNPSVVGTGEGLLAYLHTGLSLRIAHFLLIIWASSGWGSIALSSLFSHSLPRSFPALLTHEESRDATRRQTRHRLLAIIHQRSQLDRHAIFAHAENALRPYHRPLTKAEQVELHTEVIWLARWLDLPRKEAFITRDIVKRIAVLIVESREESRRRGAAGFSRKSSLTLNGDRTPQSGRTGLRRRESVEGNESVMVLFERAIQLLGLDILAVAPPNAARKVIRHTGLEELKEARFGWPELQVEMIKEGIAVAESLPDQVGVMRLCMTALKELHTYLNPGSQGVLAKMLPNALSVMRRRGATVDLPWWLPGVTVLSIELTSLPPNRLPREHSREEIIADKGRDPFLYNPRSRAAQAGNTILVAKEQIDIYVTLRNPFAFNLELKDVSLLTSGVDFASTPLAISVAPQSIQSVRITGMATSSGSLQIRGVTLRLPDGAQCDILLPVVDEAERKRQDKRKSQAESEQSKVKRQGMEARWPVRSEPIRESAAPDTIVDKWLECRVVDEQPLVWIKKTNLTHGTIMLYDGETSSIRITLENTSSVPVDFIKLSFDDSSSRAAQALIAEGELSPQHAYELEWDMINRPVMTCEDGGEILIPPGGRTTISVRCLGKVGCTDGTIRIDYGYVKRQDGAVPSSFQTRQITFPVILTVYHTLEPHSLDIVRFTPSSLPSTETTNDAKDQLVGLFPAINGHLSPVPPTPRTPGTPRLREMEEASLVETMKLEMNGDHCLFGLCVSNVYGVPFEVSLSRNGAGGQGDLLTTRLVPPGASERLVLPLPRLSLPSTSTSQPIPSLSNRQYVVDKSKRSPAQIQEERELFWYREQLLSSVSATWVEPGSKRQGTMSLRDQVFTPSLLEVYRIDDVDVEVVIEPRNSVRLVSGDFADVSVKITNRLERPFQPFVRLEPLPTSSTDPSWAQPTAPRRPLSGSPSQGIKNIIFDGCLSQLLPALEPGATGAHSLSALFLASGTYSFRAAVDEVHPQDTTQFGPPKIRFSPLCSVRVDQESL